tara:strand:+ start:46229 stop:50485 length:4257 start_codon:yes stop_codon:yes gene_type:complete
MFSVTVLLAVTISSAMYFFKIQKNEDYQNRLHFRELNEVSRSFIQSAGQLTEIAKVCEDIESLSSSCEDLLKNRVALANRSANLKSLKVSNANLINDSDLSNHRIYFHTGGKTYIKVDVTSTPTKSLPKEAVKEASNDSAKTSSTVENKNKINILEVETKDFVPANIERFPLVLIADALGTVIGASQINKKGVETADLQFQDIKIFFNEIAEKHTQRAENKDYVKDFKPTTSEILDTTIGGVDYRVFLQPSSLTSFSTSTNKLYLLGLVPANELRLAKLNVSPNTALWFVLILIISISLLPLLKLRFVSVKYAFTRSDVSQIGLGLLVAVGMSSIGINHQLFYGYLIEDKSEQATKLHNQITEEFKTEINTLRGWADFNSKDLKEIKSKEEMEKKLQTSEELNQAICRFVKTKRSAKDTGFLSCERDDLVIKNSTNSEIYDYVIEGAFILNEDGRFVEGTTTTWKQENLLVSRELDLSHRQYFRKAKECNVWGEIENRKKCDKGLVFERINNVRDGRKNTQFAIPLFNQEHEEDKLILSFGTRLRTFFHRVMPKDFGYLVFDQSGMVLFHSEEQRSLIENVFVETDNNKQLYAFVSNQNYDSGKSMDPVTFDAVYRGKSHLFSVGDLFIDNYYANAPLTLVVFFDQSGAELNNMLLLFMAVILFLFIIIPLFAYIRYTTSQPFWASLLYFNPLHANRYRSWLFLLIGGSLFCFLMMGVVFDLTLRISIWLLVTAMILKLIMKSLDPDKTVLRGAYPNLIPFVVIAVVTAIIGLSLGPIYPNDNLINWVFFIVGLGAFLTALFLYFRVPYSESYTDTVFEKERYTKTYLSFILAIVFLVAAVPASLIVNSANGYLLQHQARLQTHHLQIAEKNYLSQLADYKLIIGEAEHDNFKGNNWLLESSLQQMFPAFGKWISSVNTDNQCYTDKAIQKIFSNIAFADSMLAEITHLAKRVTSAQKERHCIKLGKDKSPKENVTGSTLNSTLQYHPDLFMLLASERSKLFIVLAILLQLVVIHRLITLVLVRRLFGDHLTNDFRISYPREHSTATEKWDILAAKLQQDDPARILLLHSTRQRIVNEVKKREIELFEDTVFNIADLVTKDQGNFAILSRLTKGKDKLPAVLLLEGYELLAFLPEKRQLALSLTEFLVKVPSVHLVIVADTAPIFRLTKQDEYPHAETETVSSTTEELGWAMLFAQFSKHYDWTPGKKYMPRAVGDVINLIENESNGWAELRDIEEDFKQYHRLVKMKDTTALITAENLQKFWKPSQIIGFFAMHGGALYRMKWELCTKDERYLLFQLASGCHVNPLNSEVLEHLMRRGYIYRDAGWHLVNDSFKRFVLHAERETDIAEWQADANTGIWSMLRIPVFTVVLVLLVVTVFSSGQAIDSALGILTAILGMIPLLLRNASLLKGGNTNLGE